MVTWLLTLKKPKKRQIFKKNLKKQTLLKKNTKIWDIKLKNYSMARKKLRGTYYQTP